MDFQDHAEPVTTPVDSPCNRTCLLNPLGICVGCGRSRNEIACWGTSSETTKQRIVHAAQQRLNEMKRVLERGRLGKPQRRGFTLVELLVVLSVIGILIGLLLPAVQATREASRRISCINHLKQIGLGFHNYHSAYRQFPVGGAGFVSATSPSLRRRWRPSWGTVLLPFMEQQGLYEQVELEAPYVDPVNHQAGGTVVPTFLCPSAPKPVMRRPNGDRPRSPARYARTDYGGNYGERGLRCIPKRGCPNNYSDLGIQSSGGRGVLLFASDPAVAIRGVLDGTSQTIMVGECPEGLHSIWIGHKNFFDQSAPVNQRVELGSRWNACAPPFASGQGDFCDFGQEFHSYHPGGAQFLLVDGSARFVSEQIDLKLFAALLSRRGGETVTTF
jgi:prepilin-type N-terminal cleavage/methylation domain-containing protein/prepilin-type processing-associated H-X9-DG protein